MEYVAIQLLKRQHENAQYDEPVDLWIPASITVRQLWTAVMEAYQLARDERDAFFQAENPTIFLRAAYDTPVSETGIRCGTRLYYTGQGEMA